MRRTPEPANKGNDTPSDPITVSPALGDGQAMRIRGGRSDTAASRLAVLISVARRLDVPAVCVVLTWTAPTAASYVICTHEAGVDWFVTYDSSIYTCDECGDPCEDADISPDPGSRERNCMRCTPCSICTRCSVTLATQERTCLSCATDAEAGLLSKGKQRRRLLVAELEMLRTDARPGL